MNALLMTGICLKVIGLDVWQTPIIKIHSIGKETVLVQQALRTTNGWISLGDRVLQIDSMSFDSLKKIPCPKINWNK